MPQASRMDVGGIFLRKLLCAFVNSGLGYAYRAMKHTMQLPIMPLLRAAALLCLALLAMAQAAFAKYGNNSDETLQLVKEALQDPDPAKLERLGDIYAKGENVGKDATEAITWYCYAMKMGSKTAARKLWDEEDKLRARPLKTPKIRKEYNDEATRDLCRYLYLVQKSPESLLDMDLYPEGIKAVESPRVPGMANPPKYNASIVRKYINKGADPNASLKSLDPRNPTSSNIDIRFSIIKQKDFKTFDYLIIRGACVNSCYNGPLFLALGDMDAYAKRNNGKCTDKTMKYLLSRGASLKNKGSWGENPFMNCLGSNDNAQGINFLFRQGLDPDEEIEERYLAITDKKKRKDLIGLRALWMAVGNRNVRGLDALIKGGADIHYKHKGKSMLDIALETCQAEDIQTETSYEKELARLLRRLNAAISSDNVAHLLRLAGVGSTSQGQD